MRPSVNWLLALIPVALALEHAGAPAPWVFFAAAVAIVPVASLIIRSTEQLARYTGDAVGGLLIQIALFIAPVLVLASYFVAPRPLELSFSRPEIGSLFMAVLAGALVAGDGRSNWYKGVQIITVYLILALMFYFIPAAM